MIVVKIEGDTFFARCDGCSRWLQVKPDFIGVDAHFVYWEGPFSCCNHRQTAAFVVEKDEMDIQ